MHHTLCLQPLLSPAHASDGLQLAAGAEAERVSVGAAGSHRVGAGPLSPEPAEPLPAGNSSAAILTRRSSHLLHLSNPDTPTVPAGSQLTPHTPPTPPAFPTSCYCSGEEQELLNGHAKLMWNQNIKSD